MKIKKIAIKQIILSLVACSVLLSFSSCSKKMAGGMEQTAVAVFADGVAEDTVMMEAPRAVKSSNVKAVRTEATFANEAENLSENGINGENISNENGNIGRKLVYNGDVSLLLEDLEETERQIANWVNSFGGYITNSPINNNTLNVTARIPAKFFNQAMEGMAEFGKTERRSIYTEDVTEQFYDLSTRLETRKILRERLENYLKNASNVKDMISIEKELNNVQSEIEAMEGQFKRLNNRIDFATITIYGHLQVNKTQIGYRYPDLSKKFSKLWVDVLNFAADFLVGIFYFVIYAIPILAAVWLLYFICFGRLGLVKKLFAFASTKAKKSSKIEKNETN